MWRREAGDVIGLADVQALLKGKYRVSSANARPPRDARSLVF